MSLWLMRGGRHGEYEDRFIAEGRIYLTWGDAFGGVDLAALKSQDEMREIYRRHFPTYSPARLANYTAQVWSFLGRMRAGDWVVMPRKNKGAIAIGEITGGCTYDGSEADADYRHFRSVRWLNQAVPRSNFGRDLIYSFGALMTICEITRNDAESRVKAIARSGWKEENAIAVATGQIPSSDGDAAVEEERAPRDLDSQGRYEISRLIFARFKGDKLKVVIAAILRANGYMVHDPGPGPDSGVDLLAAPGSLGFGEPKICIQVKCLDSPIEREVLDKLKGTMDKVRASHGLLVSWGGFKNSYDREEATEFFKVRLWDQNDVLNELLACYDRIAPELRAELPLKQVWTIADEG